MGDEDVTRDQYTWDMATKDLALTSEMTMSEAFSLTWPIRQKKLVHPFDAVTFLIRLFGPLDGNRRQNAAARGEALAELLDSRGES